MRRWMYLLSLIAAFSATPLRLAEAAHDFAASLAELADDGTLDAPDGGVGDDSDATIRAETTQAPAPDCGHLAFLLSSHFLLTIPPHRCPAQRAAQPPPGSILSLTTRLSALQCFLC